MEIVDNANIKQLGEKKYNFFVQNEELKKYRKKINQLKKMKKEGDKILNDSIEYKIQGQKLLYQQELEKELEKRREKGMKRLVK